MIINWSRLFPRLTILFLLLVALWWGQNSLIAWQIRTNIAKQTGAAAQIGDVRTDLPKANLVLSQLQLYDPKRPERKLFSAEKVTIQGNRADILARFLHFPEVTVEGIRVEVEGTEGGDLVPDRLWQKFKERVPRELGEAGDLDWTVFVTEKPEAAVDQFLGQLETSQLIETLKTRWPKEVKQFEETAAKIRARFQKVKSLSDKTGQGVDKFQLLQEILQELEGADLGIQELLTAFTQLRTKAQQDYQEVTDAAKRDREKVKALQIPSIDSDRISETVVGPEIREQWEKTVAWGDWAASLLAPVQIGDDMAPLYERFGLTPPKRIRGERIPLTAFDVRPELQIDRVNLTGQILFGSLPVYFNGAVRDIASPLPLGPGPTVAQFCFSGFGVPESPVMPEEQDHLMELLSKAIDPNVFPNLYVTMSVDRIGENEEDTLIVCCPIYQFPEKILGDQDRFALHVTPGTSRLDGVLVVRGENLSGQIRLVQSGSQLSALLPEKLRRSGLQELLDRSLATIEQFEAKMLVSGTRSEPVYTVTSNLGDVIRPQLENIVLAQWNTLRQEIESSIDSEAEQGLAALEATIRQQVDPVMQDVNTTRNEWERQLAMITDLPLDQMAQSQLDKLSPKDRQRLESFVQAPAVQAVLQNRQTPQAQEAQLDQAIQRGVDKLQDKIPGLLDKLRKK